MPTTPDPQCLNCGHTFALHTDQYFCYALADGTPSPILTGKTCLCGYWNPPADEPEPEPEVPSDPETDDGTSVPGAPDDTEPDA